MSSSVAGICQSCGASQIQEKFHRVCVKCGLEEATLTKNSVANALQRITSDIETLKTQVRKLNGIWGKSDKNPDQDALF